MSKQNCRISKKRFNFSIISNEVAQGLTYDLAALGLYIYLFSLPHDWEFHKSHLRKVCNIGEKKLTSLLRILTQHRLIKIAQIRKENGQFSHFDIHVDDGSSFSINKLDDSAQPQVIFDRTAENGPAVKQSYKEHIHKDENIKENKDKNICAIKNIAPKRFNDFWSVYPKKKDKKRAEEIWMKENLDNKADQIIKDVKQRILNDQNWEVYQYIPHPSTYLRNERWTDEMVISSESPKKNNFNPFSHVMNDLRKEGILR